MIKLGLAIWMLLTCISLFSQNTLRFVEERIDFELIDDKFNVNGIYSFANSESNYLCQNIYFPFAKSTDSIQVNQVFNLNTFEAIEFTLTKEGILFQINILPFDTLNVNIAYSQKLNKINTYVLESTQTWKEPLHLANYSLTIDREIKVEKFSFEPDTIIDGVYHWRKERFYPKKNFIIKISTQ